MFYCPQCGTANREGSHFCNLCGFPAGNTSEEAVEDAPATGNVAATDGSPDDEVSETTAEAEVATWSELAGDDASEPGGYVIQDSGDESAASPSSDVPQANSLSEMPPADSETGDDDLPSWMKSLGDVAPQTSDDSEEPFEATSAPADEKTDMPAWLQQLVGTEQSPDVSPVASDEASEPPSDVDATPESAGLLPGAMPEVADAAAEAAPEGYVVPQADANGQAVTPPEERRPVLGVTELLADTQVPRDSSAHPGDDDAPESLAERDMAVRPSPVAPATPAGNALATLFASMPLGLPGPSEASNAMAAHQATVLDAGTGSEESQSSGGRRLLILLIAVIVVALILLAVAIVTGRIPLQ